MPGLSPEQIEVLMKTVSDPRYTLEKAMRALQPTAELKHAVISRGLVGQMNKAYGWNLPSNGSWDVERVSDIMYDIVLKPGYTLDKFIAAIEAGRTL
jgi:hypothetical protein